MGQPLIRRVEDTDVHSNFQEIERTLREADHVLRQTATGTIALATGDNAVTLPQGITNPIGRHTVFIDAAVTLFDKGLSGGKWIVNSSGPANARFVFF